jgi:hypothetical protein
VIILVRLPVIPGLERVSKILEVNDWIGRDLS